MTHFSILTANTALGIPHSDSLWGDVHSLYKFHGWKVIPFLLTGNRFAALFNYSSHPHAGRLPYFQKHVNYEKTLAMVKEDNPDILVLNEVVFQAAGEALVEKLRALGYNSFAWGMSAHHSDATVCTLIASRIPVQEISPNIPQKPQMGGGGGAIAVRLQESPVTIVGLHLACGVPAFIDEQLQALVNFANAEKELGRQVILAGDFNAPGTLIQKTKGFELLDLKSLQSSCPLSLPQFFQEECDHIYISKAWTAEKVSYPAFGSDHLAVAAEVSFA